MTSQSKTLDYNAEKAYTAFASIQRTLKRLVLLIVGVASLGSNAQAQLAESVAQKMRGFEGIPKQVTRISLNTSPLKSEDFPKWTLTYDGELSDQDDLRVVVEPKDAFMVTPTGKGRYEVSVAHPEMLFSKIGNLKDVSLSAVLMANRQEMIDGSGGSRCLVTAHFTASGTGKTLPLKEIFENKYETKPRFIVEPDEEARFVQILDNEAEFARAHDQTAVKVTFAFFDAEVGREIKFPATLKTCGTEATPSATTAPKTEPVRKATLARRRRQDTSQATRWKRSITYETNQYYCEQATIPDTVDYSRCQTDQWGGTHCPVFRARWVCSYGCCTGYWWTQDQFGRVAWWYGPHETTWWSYYWEYVGDT